MLIFVLLGKMTCHLDSLDVQLKENIPCGPFDISSVQQNMEIILVSLYFTHCLKRIGCSTRPDQHKDIVSSMWYYYLGM